MKSMDEEKEKLLAEIGNALENGGICKISTCDCDYYGWSVLRHHAMSALSRQGVAGCRISHEYKFEVHDWTVVKENTTAEPARLPNPDTLEEFMRPEPERRF